MTKCSYFISDLHLGAPDEASSRLREAAVVAWLEQIKPQADYLFLMGDIFDFWFEYKTVIPKGFLRLQAKLLELSQAGVKIHFFVGNHDLWMWDYFEQELGIPVHHKPLRIELGGKRFFLAHGDGLGPGDKGYKRLKKIFTNPFFQWLFRWLHPDIGVALASGLSRRSRAAQGESENQFLGSEREWLLQYAERKLAAEPQTDFFVFGHRHLALDILLSNGQSRYLNLGEWIKAKTYAVFDGQDLKLCYFEPK